MAPRAGNLGPWAEKDGAQPFERFCSANKSRGIWRESIGKTSFSDHVRLGGTWGAPVQNHEPWLRDYTGQLTLKLVKGHWFYLAGWSSPVLMYC
jgi:hypothetical protein